MSKPFDLKAFIIATLRRASYRWIPRNEALVAARVERGIYRCAICGQLKPKKEITLDHIIPIVPLTGWDGWENFIQRLFCNKEGFQVICKKPCHAEKTKAENKIRRENNKKLDK
jgi:5-methylcytosine-specific restriction endonuclease McrA